MVESRDDAAAAARRPGNCQPLVLHLISHARTPPLSGYGEIHLHYDCRSVANPPKAIRDKQTGLHKPLREHLLSDGSFVQMLDGAEADIRRSMAQLTAEDDHESRPGKIDVSASSSVYDTSEATSFDEHADDKVSVRSLGEEEVSGSHADGKDSDDEQVTQQNVDATEALDAVVVRAAAFCARGHHRSVAFVEELARRGWPKGWSVVVVHRDLHERHPGASAKKKKRGKFRDNAFLRESD